MIIETLTNAKNHLSQLVERVRRGERVRIVVRGVPVADLVPVTAVEKPDDDPIGIAALQRHGVLRPKLTALAAELLEPGPRATGKSLVDILREDRDAR